jgi:Zn-finger protein
MAIIYADVNVRAKCSFCYQELPCYPVDDDREGQWIEVERCDRCYDAHLKEHIRNAVSS